MIDINSIKPGDILTITSVNETHHRYKKDDEVIVIEVHIIHDRKTNIYVYDIKHGIENYQVLNPKEVCYSIRKKLFRDDEVEVYDDDDNCLELFNKRELLYIGNLIIEKNKKYYVLHNNKKYFFQDFYKDLLTTIYDLHEFFKTKTIKHEVDTQETNK